MVAKIKNCSIFSDTLHKNPRYMYDFDEIIDRRGTWTEKYAELNLMLGTEDVLPLWVA